MYIALWSNLTMTMLQDIPTFDGQDVSKLEGWFMDIGNHHWHSNRAAHAWLRPNQAASPTCSSVRSCKQQSAGMKSRAGILRLKLCNANIHTYTSCFMEIQQKDNETLAAYIHHFKTVAKWCTFDNDTVAICFFVQRLWDAPCITAKTYEKEP